MLGWPRPRAERIRQREARIRAPQMGHPVSNLECLQVRCRHLAVTAGLEVVSDLLPFVQAGHTRALDCGDVDKSVFGAIVGLDETEAFSGVEEFNGAVGHKTSFAR